MGGVVRQQHAGMDERHACSTVAVGKQRSCAHMQSPATASAAHAARLLVVAALADADAHASACVPFHSGLHLQGHGWQ